MNIATFRSLVHSRKLLHSAENAFNIRTFHNSLEERIVFLSNTPLHHEKRLLLARGQLEYRFTDYKLIYNSIRCFSTTDKNKNQTELKSKPQDENIRDLHNHKNNENQNQTKSRESQAKIESQEQENQDERTSVKTQPEEKLSLTAQFKKMWKDYWYVLLPVHLVTSSIWFGGIYYLSTSGVDIPALLESMHFSETMISKLKDSSMGHVAITYMCYKIITPLRYTVTLGGTTLAIKYLSQLGYIRPVPSKERLKEMYREAKKNA